MSQPLTFFIEYSLSIAEATARLTSTAQTDEEPCLPCAKRAAEQRRIGTRTHSLQRYDTDSPDGDEDTSSSGEATTVRWKGCIGVEGELTGDGRFIQPGALRWETLPIPLRYVPADVGAHQGAVVVGRIDGMERVDSTGEIVAEGDFDLGSDAGREAARQVGEDLMRGVSMDLDDVAFEVRVAADAPALMNLDPEQMAENVKVAVPDADGRVKVEEMNPDDEVMVTTDARIRAATIVAVPAFHRAQIALSAAAPPSPTEIDLEEEFNWVDDVGGLPSYIRRIADHIMKKGKAEGHAIAIAVNACKKMCATGDLNFPGKQNVNPGSRAEACAAVAEWEAKKAKAKADEADLTTLTDAGAIIFRRDGSTVYRKVSQKERDRLAEEGKAMKDGAFPIDNCSDLANAIKAAGRAKDKEAAHKHIKSRAKDLDCPDVEIPEDWATRPRIQAMRSTSGYTVNTSNATSTTISFGYNEGQWRNPHNGRWIDMPNVALDNLAGFFDLERGSLRDTPDVILDAIDAMVEQRGGMEGHDPDSAEYRNSVDLALNEVANIKNVIATDGDTMDPTDLDTLETQVEKAELALEAFQDNYIAAEQTDIGAGDTDIGADDVVPSGLTPRQIRAQIAEAEKSKGVWQGGNTEEASKRTKANIAAQDAKIEALRDDLPEGEPDNLRDLRKKAQSNEATPADVEEALSTMGGPGYISAADYKTMRDLQEKLAELNGFDPQPPEEQGAGWRTTDLGNGWLMTESDPKRTWGGSMSIRNDFGDEIARQDGTSKYLTREDALQIIGNHLNTVPERREGWKAVEGQFYGPGFLMNADGVKIHKNPNTGVHIVSRPHETRDEGQEFPDLDSALASVDGPAPAGKGDWPEKITDWTDEQLQEQLHDDRADLENAPDDLSNDGRSSIMDEITSIQHELHQRGLGPDPATVDVHGEPFGDLEDDREPTGPHPQRDNPDYWIEDDADLPVEPDWASMTDAELLARAEAMGISGAGGMTRNELIEAMQAILGSALHAAAAPIDTDAPPAAFFSDPHLKEPTALKVTSDGHVYGHLATWGTCHLTHTARGTCVEPPKSRSRYAYFNTGSVMTREGSEFPVGQITLDTRHAKDTMSAAATLAHYDHTGKAVADVTVGEDAYGIWVAGALRPGVTAEQVRTLRASPLSGDWRRIGTGMELVAALAVNVPGFPVPRPQGLVAAGTMTSLVAAGMLPPRRVRRPGTRGALSTDDLRYLKRLAARERAEEDQRRLDTLSRAASLAADLRRSEMLDRASTLATRIRRERVHAMAARISGGGQ